MIGEAVRRTLRWVKVSDPTTDLSAFPTFLIIGPQRTGTTWLHAHLRHHPQIFLAEPKELHFFNSLKSRDPRRFVSDEVGFYLQYFREALWRRAAKAARCVWNYGAIYAPRVRGEATASYAALDADVIADIVALNPDIKAILMIRNPIERAWSHAKKDLVRNRKRRMADVPDAEFRAFFADPYQLRCARYVEQYDLWAAHLRPGHLMVGAFDDITTRPEELLLDVMRFLGVRADRRYLDPSLREPVNTTETTVIPEQYRGMLRDLLAADIAQLKERFGFSWP